jgi:DNA-binding CsgD family transcriptional regulator
LIEPLTTSYATLPTVDPKAELAQLSFHAGRVPADLLTRRRDCREHLRTAHRMLSETGADGFARRAVGELRATGEKVRDRSGHAYEKLTMQEVAVARLVASGAISHEVAVHLCISKRTVNAHLHRIFRKLGITSRGQLKDHPDLVLLGSPRRALARPGPVPVGVPMAGRHRLGTSCRRDGFRGRVTMAAY